MLNFWHCDKCMFWFIATVYDAKMYTSAQLLNLLALYATSPDFFFSDIHTYNGTTRFHCKSADTGTDACKMTLHTNMLLCHLVIPVCSTSSHINTSKSVPTFVGFVQLMDYIFYVEFTKLLFSSYLLNHISCPWVNFSLNGTLTSPHTLSKFPKPTCFWPDCDIH